MSTATPDILDAATLDELSAVLAPEQLGQILNSFASDIGRLEGEFAAAAATPDEAGCRRAAHALAGAAAAIGARRLEATARRAMDPAMPQPCTLAAAMQAETAAALAALAARMEGVRLTG